MMIITQIRGGITVKNIAILGASGHTGKYIIRKFKQMENVKLTLFVRNPGKLSEQEKENSFVVTGDAMNPVDVRRVMEGQDVLLCSLEGDVLTMAKNIVTALPDTSVKRIIWITGMGIHGEITGARGEMLSMYAKKMPEYIEAADLIADSSAATTLLRCPMIQDGDNETYFLTPEGEQPADRPVDRAAIAQCMADMVCDESLGINQSLGITN